MDPEARASEARFQSYVESLATVLSHANRLKPLKDFGTGLLPHGRAQSAEPMAAIVAPELSAEALAIKVPEEGWRTVAWRECANERPAKILVPEPLWGHPA